MTKRQRQGMLIVIGCVGAVCWAFGFAMGASEVTKRAAIQIPMGPLVAEVAVLLVLGFVGFVLGSVVITVIMLDKSKSHRDLMIAAVQLAIRKRAREEEREEA